MEELDYDNDEYHLGEGLIKFWETSEIESIIEIFLKLNTVLPSIIRTPPWTKTCSNMSMIRMIKLM